MRVEIFANKMVTMKVIDDWGVICVCVVVDGQCVVVKVDRGGCM